MILAGDFCCWLRGGSLFVFSEKDGCKVCVFTLCCFLAEYCKALGKFVRNKGRMMKK